MNFKKLAAWLTLSATAATPLAIAQNPTILQGSYISNVFGNSNFVLNPNAQTNVANVTNATRSTTTPLVATSEFTLSLASGANATWTLRAFDQGMKGQNCEARFTYRGFATATTKAELVQNSLVVASLTLTPTTDPRIASINFPCGDLTYATTFRIAQTTANMTGTNEIGGIYVGLATNMANVAQAELFGGFTTSSLNAGVTGAAAAWTSLTNRSGSVTAFGKATSAANTMSVTFNALPAGEYMIVIDQPFFVYGGTGGHSCRFSVLEDTSGDRKTFATNGTVVGAGAYNAIQAQTSTRFVFNSVASRTFRVQLINSGWTTSANGDCYSDLGINGGIYVYRFPSSSELVVTPERQNVFGFTSGSALDYTTKSGSYVTPSGFTMDPATGKCENDGTNIACKIATLPPGSYDVKVTAPMIAQGSSGGNQSCYWGISDGINTDVALAQNVTQNSATTAYDGISTVSRQFTYSSVKTNVIFKLIVKEASSGGASANCLVGASGGRYWQMLVTPLNQPSNSALYVQGPVLGAQTGAAIASGYQGYLQEAVRTSDVNLSVVANTPTDITGLSISLDPGVWEIESFGAMYINNAAGTGQSGRVGVWQITDNSNNVQRENRCGFVNSVQLNAFMNCFVKIRLLVTSTTTYKARALSIENSGATTNPTGVQVIGTANAAAVIRAIKVN